MKKWSFFARNVKVCVDSALWRDKGKQEIAFLISERKKTILDFIDFPSTTFPGCDLTCFFLVRCHYLRKIDRPAFVCYFNLKNNTLLLKKLLRIWSFIIGIIHQSSFEKRNSNWDLIKPVSMIFFYHWWCLSLCDVWTAVGKEKSRERASCFVAQTFDFLGIFLDNVN